MRKGKFILVLMAATALLAAAGIAEATISRRIIRTTREIPPAVSPEASTDWIEDETPREIDPDVVTYGDMLEIVEEIQADVEIELMGAIGGFKAEKEVPLGEVENISLWVVLQLKTGSFVFYREYDAKLARWLTPDPAGYVDGQNLYAAYFVPNGVDPLGLETVEERNQLNQGGVRGLFLGVAEVAAEPYHLPRDVAFAVFYTIMRGSRPMPAVMKKHAHSMLVHSQSEKIDEGQSRLKVATVDAAVGAGIALTAPVSLPAIGGANIGYGIYEGDTRRIGQGAGVLVYAFAMAKAPPLKGTGIAKVDAGLSRVSTGLSQLGNRTVSVMPARIRAPIRNLQLRVVTSKLSQEFGQTVKARYETFGGKGVRGEFGTKSLQIRVYELAFTQKGGVARTILHEQGHFYQLLTDPKMPIKYGQYQGSYGYKQNPYEIGAREWSSNTYNFLKAEETAQPVFIFLINRAEVMNGNGRKE